MNFEQFRFRREEAKSPSWRVHPKSCSEILPEYIFKFCSSTCRAVKLSLQEVLVTIHVTYALEIGQDFRINIFSLLPPRLYTFAFVLLFTFSSQYGSKILSIWVHIKFVGLNCSTVLRLRSLQLILLTKTRKNHWFPLAIFGMPFALYGQRRTALCDFDFKKSFEKWIPQCVELMLFGFEMLISLVWLVFVAFGYDFWYPFLDSHQCY